MNGMNGKLRPLALLISLSLLAGCQQAVRPNLADAETVASPAVPAATPSTAATSITIEPVATAMPEVLPGPSAIAVAVSVTPLRGADVFARINRGLSPKSCSAGSSSEQWRKRYAGNPTGFANHLEQILPLLDFVSAEVERSGLPAEFVFIPLVESWYRPEAIGPGGPAGMWQMISSTARNHGIHIQHGYDGRLSPVESTRAALSYLKTLQGMFGDWQAIVMAYNAGEGRMMRAFRRSENRTVSASQRKPHGLSNITYDYVAKLQALSCLVSEPERHGLRLPLETQFEPLAPVLMDADVRSLGEFAARQGKNPAQLRKLNPGYKGGKVASDVPRLVLTPLGTYTGSSSDALAVLEPEDETGSDSGRHANRRAATSRTSTHKVSSGESLWSIAKRYHLSIDQLRSSNRLGSGSLVHPGQMLRLLP